MSSIGGKKGTTKKRNILLWLNLSHRCHCNNGLVMYDQVGDGFVSEWVKQLCATSYYIVQRNRVESNFMKY